MEKRSTLIGGNATNTVMQPRPSTIFRLRQFARAAAAAPIAGVLIMN